MASTAGGLPVRRGTYINRACNGCRRRRCKCDGARPTCGSCSFYGHQCSWGNEDDAHRPPTKQFVETLRVKVQVLENELARLRAIKQGGYVQLAAPGSSASLISVPPTRKTGIPSQSRPTPLLIGIASRQPIQQSPWLAYLGEHPDDFPSGIIYQFIFNVDSTLPFNEQSEAARYSLTCDWNRHLPSLDGIQLTRLEHDTLLDRCFKYSSCWLMSIVPQFFLCDMLRALAHAQESPKIEYYSPLLHCSLLALATAFSDNPSMKQLGTRNKFAEKAKQLLHHEICRPNLCLVQALVFLSEYHCGLGESERGYMYLGMGLCAIRVLQFGKLEPWQPNWAVSTTVSDWSFWSIYSHDKLMSLDMNMGFGLHSKGYFSLDLPCVDWEIDRWHDAQTTTVKQSLGSSLTRVFVESCKLALIAETVISLHRSHTVAFPFTGVNRVAEINWRLDAWLSELPTELLIADDTSTSILPHIILVNMLYWWLVLSLHQPYYRLNSSRDAPPVSIPRPFGDLSDVLCDRAACKTLFLVDLYSRWHGLQFFPRNMIQAIRAAGVLFFRQQATIDAEQEDRRAIHECIAALRAIAKTWQCADSYATFLESLLN